MSWLDSPYQATFGLPRNLNWRSLFVSDNLYFVIYPLNTTDHRWVCIWMQHVTKFLAALIGSLLRPSVHPIVWELRLLLPRLAARRRTLFRYAVVVPLFPLSERSRQFRQAQVLPMLYSLFCRCLCNGKLACIENGKIVLFLHTIDSRCHELQVIQMAIDGE